MSSMHHAAVTLSDNDLPDFSGTDLLRALFAHGISVPFVFFSPAGTELLNTMVKITNGSGSTAGRERMENRS